LHSQKVRVIGGSIQKTSNTKMNAQFVHDPAACNLVPMRGTRENLWEGTQLEVACGKKFCKAGRRIKNADLVTTDRPGRGNGRVGDFPQTSNFACSNGDRSFGAALLALADDRLGQATIGAIPACHRVAQAAAENAVWFGNGSGCAWLQQMSLGLPQGL
jgi:hypothetical protein